MVYTKRQQIMNEVLARFQSILVAGGYETDMGERVNIWRTAPITENDVLPILLCRDTDESMTDGPFSKHSMRLKVELELCVASNVSATDARTALGDIIKAIGVDLTWGGLAINTEPGPNSMRLDTADRDYGSIYATFFIVYRTDEWNAYS